MAFSRSVAETRLEYVAQMEGSKCEIHVFVERQEDDFGRAAGMFQPFSYFKAIYIPKEISRMITSGRRSAACSTTAAPLDSAPAIL